MFSEEKGGSGYWINNHQGCYTWPSLHALLVANSRCGKGLTGLGDRSHSLGRDRVHEGLTGHFWWFPIRKSSATTNNVLLLMYTFKGMLLFRRRWESF